MTRSLLLTAAILLTSIGSASASYPASGMLLGIYAFPNYQGLRVTGTMPEYSAHGKLFRNDVLTRVTADGVNMFPTKSLPQFEFAKDQIGPNRPAALEVFRPGQGYIYLWVEFIPVGGQAGPAAMKAMIMTEAQKPGAARMFQPSKAHPQPGKLPAPIEKILPPGFTQPQPGTDWVRNAANLFGR